jgi:hypothetical protein
MSDAGQPELLDAEGKFKAALALETKSLDGAPSILKHALLIHNQTINAVSNFHGLYEACQVPGKDGEEHLAFPGEQDLLRAMLMFSCSGLDAVVKQLVQDTLGSVLKDDVGAQREFQKFVERRLKKGGTEEGQDRMGGSSLDLRLVSELLVSFEPRAELIRALTRSLTSDSLQSRDQLLKVAAHFALTREDIMVSPDVTKEAFDARNQIVHEMDIDLASGDQRRARSYETMVRWSDNIVGISSNFIDKVSTKIAASSVENGKVSAGIDILGYEEGG